MTSKTATAARHSSETAEHFTPAAIVAAARTVLGRIDLDPASCEFANRLIKADRYYTQATNGFRQPWYGRIFLNPPGGMSDNEERVVKAKCRETGSCGLPVPHTHEGVEASQRKWWFKLVREYAANRVVSAVYIGFSIEILQVTQGGAGGLAIPLDFPLCIPASRIDYDRDRDGVRVAGGAPPHASVIVLLPSRARRKEQLATFVREFGPIGRCINATAEPT